MPSIGLNEIPCSAAVFGVEPPACERFERGVTEKRDAGVEAVAAKVEEPFSGGAGADGGRGAEDGAGPLVAAAGARLSVERGGTEITPPHFRQRIFAPCGGMIESSKV